MDPKGNRKERRALEKLMNALGTNTCIVTKGGCCKDFILSGLESKEKVISDEIAREEAMKFMAFLFTQVPYKTWDEIRKIFQEIKENDNTFANIYYRWIEEQEQKNKKGE